MKRFRRILLNALTALSLMLCAAATILWIRSPAVFDRVAWTNRAGQYWEVTTLWGDVALVRVDACPTVITPRWETYTFANLLRENDFHAIGDGVLVDREPRAPGQDLPEWGRGFSRERGILLLGPYARNPVTDIRFYHTPFTRWTLPLWFPALAFSVWPLIRITQAMVRRRRRKSLLLASRPLSWLARLRRAIPSLLVLAILLMWWRGYWAMDRVAWAGRTSSRYLSTCRGVIVFEIGPSLERLFNEQLERSLGTATPTTIPYDDVFRVPDWNHTYRRSIWHVRGLLFERFTFEPSPWGDLSRNDLPLTFDLDSTLRDVNRFGFYFNTTNGPVAIIPFWLLAVLAAIILLRQMYSAMQRRRRIQSNHCVICGYDLRASPERCPECGEGVVNVSLPETDLRR